MDNRVRRFSKSFEIDGKKATLVVSEGNICFVLLGKGLVPDWRVENTYLSLKILDDNRLLKRVRHIIKHNPKLPPAGRYELDSRDVTLYAKEGIGYVMLIDIFNDNFYVASQINKYMPKSIIESIQNNPAKASNENIKVLKKQRIDGCNRYLWLKDRVVDMQVEPTLQIRGSFDCAYCGQKVKVLTATSDSDTAKCHNCGLFYICDTPTITFQINKDALEYGFDLETDNESD